jgi:predicted nucleic acid-binding protein
MSPSGTGKCLDVLNDFAGSLKASYGSCRWLPNRRQQFVVGCLCPGFLKGAVSHAVLAEAEGNILTNLPPSALTRYRQEILRIPLVVAPVPSTIEREAAAPITGEKDAHVLASALHVGAHYLITLDKGVISQIIQEAQLSLHALLPGEFITRQLPTHLAYRAIRSD